MSAYDLWDLAEDSAADTALTNASAAKGVPHRLRRSGQWRQQTPQWVRWAARSAHAVTVVGLGTALGAAASLVSLPSGPMRGVTSLALALMVAGTCTMAARFLDARWRVRPTSRVAAALLHSGWEARRALRAAERARDDLSWVGPHADRVAKHVEELADRIDATSGGRSASSRTARTADETQAAGAQRRVLMMSAARAVGTLRTAAAAAASGGGSAPHPEFDVPDCSAADARNALRALAL